MAQDHAHALAQAKEQLLAQRRRLIERFAAGWCGLAPLKTTLIYW